MSPAAIHSCCLLLLLILRRLRMNSKHRSLLQISSFLFFNLASLVQTLNGPNLPSPFTFADGFQYSPPGGNSRAASSKIRRYLDRNFPSPEKQPDASLSSKEEVLGRHDVKRRNHLFPKVTALDNEANDYDYYLASSSSSPRSFENSLTRALNVATSDRLGPHPSNLDQLRSFLRRLLMIRSFENLLLKSGNYSGNPDSRGKGSFSGDRRTSKRTGTRPTGSGANPVFLGFGQETSNAALDAIARLMMASEESRSNHGAHHDRAKESIQFIG